MCADLHLAEPRPGSSGIPGLAARGRNLFSCLPAFRFAQSLPRAYAPGLDSFALPALERDRSGSVVSRVITSSDWRSSKRRRPKEGLGCFIQVCRKRQLTSTPGVSPGVLFSFCAEACGTEARKGFRATGRREGCFGRIPCSGMVKDGVSGSFDSPLVALLPRGRSR